MLSQCNRPYIEAHKGGCMACDRPGGLQSSSAGAKPDLLIV
jgi:hypothetical protein